MAGRYRAYPEYKDSGVEWFNEIPTHWKQSRLKFLALINMGQSPSSEDCNQDGLGIPFLQGNAEFCRKSPVAVNYCEKPKKIAKQGEFLFSVRAPVGALNIADKKYGIGRGLCAIKPSEEFYKQYLWWLVPILKTELITVSTGSTFEAVSVEQVSNVVLFLPTLISEQTQIANFLDHETAKIDTLIEKQQQLITLLQEKRQAVISHAVTRGLNPDAPMKDSGVEWLGEVPEHWEVRRLKNVAKIIDCRNKTPQYFENGKYFVARTTNVKDQQLNLDGALYTDDTNFKIWTQRGIPPVGSILFTREAPAGEVCIVPENLKFCMGQRMMNFICDDPSFNFYLFDFLISDCLTRYIASVSHGSTVSHLRVEQVENIPLLLPPIEESFSIHNHIKRLKNRYELLISRAQEGINLLQERRTALISAAVTGKIDVRDWQPPTPSSTSEPLQ